MRKTHCSKYFCGNKISEYGLQRGYLDYRTLSQAFDAVMVNDITKLFFSEVNGEFNEPEQVNGYICNDNQIEELRDELDEPETHLAIHPDDSDAENRINEIHEEIEELEYEQDRQQEIFQYFIVSSYGAELLQEYTNDPVFYLPVIDAYVWGVTHWGTSWDYVLTDVKLKLDDQN